MSSQYQKDVLSTFLNQVWRVVSGPLLLLCIPLFLTDVEQGYWYTFISVAALSTLADLGFSNIILQFAAHEFAFLHFTSDRKIAGDAHHLDKLASFFRFSLSWLTKVVLVVFPLIVMGGYWFIASKGEAGVYWQGAWMVYAIFSAFLFINSMILSFFEGCNSVSQIQRIRFQIACITTCAMMAGLLLDLHLWALAGSSVMGAVTGAYFIICNFRVPMGQLLQRAAHFSYPWWLEFFPLIWRYAISWGSGFLVFQLFTPVAFYFQGPVAAGKIGISIAMWTAGFNIAISWITAITPQMNMYIAEKKWKALDAAFRNGMMKSVGTMCMGGAAFFAFALAFQDSFFFFQRILSISGMGILFLAWLIQVPVNGMAIYLRAHKKEPLVKISCINAIIVVCGTAICGKIFTPEYMFLGFLTGTIFQVVTIFGILRDYQWQHSAYDGVK